MPGIILAIMLPGTAFTLLDSNGKKTASDPGQAGAGISP